MFVARPRGLTVARVATPSNTIRRRIERAVYDPHSAAERFDPEFQLALLCDVCGHAGTSPRRLVREAIRTHLEEKHAHHDGAVSVRVLYPKQ